ncbi:MAG: AAA family ATPase [Nitrososphaeria archaeon]
MIEKIDLFNFLSHRNTSIELEDGVNVFVGNNGSGKSSVVDALTYALYGKHTRDSNTNIVFRGSPGGYTRVIFSVNGRRYTVERKFDKNGRLAGAVIKDEKGLVVAGERKQYGESVEGTVARILGLDYDKMKVVAIIQQGELDRIINYTPKDFKELINGVVGIDVLGKAFETMGQAIDLFKKTFAEKYGYGVDSLAQLESDTENLKQQMQKARAEAERLQNELGPLQAERDKAESEHSVMVALKTKFDELRNLEKQFSRHVAEKRAELTKEKAELERDIPVAEKYLSFIRSDAQHELEQAEKELEDLDKEEKEVIKALEAASNAFQRAKDIENEIGDIKEDVESSKKKIEQLRASLKPVDPALLMPEKEVEDVLDKIRAQVEELEKKKARLEEVLKNYQELESSGVCPVCGSRVEGEDLGKRRQHIVDEIKGVEEQLRKLKNDEKATREKLKAMREAQKIMIENRGTNERISMLSENLEKLQKSVSDKEKELAEYRERAKALDELSKRYSALENRKKELTKTRNELFRALTEAKTWLSSKNVSSEEQIGAMREKLSQLEKSISGPDELIDGDAWDLHERIQSLKRETEGYSDEKFSRLENRLRELREKVDKIKAEIVFQNTSAGGAEERLRQLEPVREAMKRAKVYVERFEKIRSEIFHRDGELAKGMRFWAVRSISAFSTDYIQLFGTGISEIKISEGESKVGIECYTSSGFQDINAMSGGEKVAIAVAIRFAIAKLLSTGNIDFIIMDEPTNYLDEERKKAFVDLVRNMGQAVRQLVIITHDREIFENESVNAVFSFEKINGESHVTKS